MIGLFLTFFFNNMMKQPAHLLRPTVITLSFIHTQNRIQKLPTLNLLNLLGLIKELKECK